MAWKPCPNTMLAGERVFVSNLMFKTEFAGLAIGVSRSVFIATSKHEGANGRKIFFINVFYQ